MPERFQPRLLPSFSLVLLGCLAASCAWQPANHAQAQVAILANLTSQTFRAVTVANDPPGNTDLATPSYRLMPGDVIAVWVGGSAELRLHPKDVTPEAGEPVFRLRPGAAYFVATDGSGPIVRELELGDLAPEAYPGLEQILEVPVKLLVDDDEPTREHYWQNVLTRRVAAASAILERTCRVRLKVVGYGIWTSPAESSGLTDGMQAFEQTVDPTPARIAIGFASQYGPPDADHPHLGVVRGELGRHILLRERGGRFAEPEKLELLVHELGHYFGAVHVAHDRSVMRPKLADGRARVRGFRIAFDPLNALIMNHHVTEWHAGRLPGEFRPEVAARLARLQLAIRELNRHVEPEEDEVLSPAPRTPGSTEAPAVEPGTPSSTEARSAVEDPVWEGVRQLLREFGSPPPADAGGDKITDFYVHRLALAAQRLPASSAPRSFLIALGIGFEDQGFLESIPYYATKLRTIELPEHRERRHRHVARATLAERHDLALHFFVSAMLTAEQSEITAGLAGLFKELADARGGSGFDGTDLAADLAGIAWASDILGRRQRLSEIATRFRSTKIKLQ